MNTQEKYTNLLERFLAQQDTHFTLLKEHNALKRTVRSLEEKITTLTQSRLAVAPQEETDAVSSAPMTYSTCPTIHTQRHGDINDPALIQETVTTYEARIKELSSMCDTIADGKQQSYEQEIAKLKDQIRILTEEGQKAATELSTMRKELSKIRKADNIHKKMIDWAKCEKNIKFPPMTVLNSYDSLKSEIEKKTKELDEKVKFTPTQEAPEPPLADIIHMDVREWEEPENEEMVVKHEGDKIAYNDGEPCPHLEHRPFTKQIAKIGKGYCVKDCPYFSHIDRDQQLLWCKKKTNL